MRTGTDIASRRVPAMLLVFLVVLLVTNAAAQPPSADSGTAGSQSQDHLAVLCSLEDSFAVIANKAKPGVVSITAVHSGMAGSRTSAGWLIPRKSRFDDQAAGRTRKLQSSDEQDGDSSVTATGSGVIVKHVGSSFYVLTNQHVVGNASRVTVSLIDETDLKGRVAGIDPVTDLAVVVISSPKLTDANVIPLGDSDQVEVGAWAIALGSPLGFQETMTVGVVSALKRQLEDEETLYTDLIQTDAAINPGNSGGPLLDVEGRVIGINTAIASPTGGFVGLGFAIPINIAKSVLDTLISNGRVIRGWLGVGIQDLSPILQQYYGVENGVLVASLDSKGPAKRAGVQDEDVVVSIDGIPIKDIFQMQSMIANAKPGGPMKLNIVRARRGQEVSIVVAQSPNTPPPPRPDEDKPREGLGLKVRTLSGDLAKRVGLEGIRGVIVIDITSGGVAEEAGIEVGDVITHMNRRSIDSDTGFQDMIVQMRAGDIIALKVVREGSPRMIGLKREQ